MIFLRAHNDHFLCLSNEALANLSARAFAERYLALGRLPSYWGP